MVTTTDECMSYRQFIHTSNKAARLWALVTESCSFSFSVFKRVTSSCSCNKIALLPSDLMMSYFHSTVYLCIYSYGCITSGFFLSNCVFMCVSVIASHPWLALLCLDLPCLIHKSVSVTLNSFLKESSISRSDQLKEQASQDQIYQKEQAIGSV